MTDTATAAPTDHEKHHPSDLLYVKVAIFLAVVTGIEVAWSYIDMPTVLQIGGLGLMMAVKFGVVAAFFMHLRFDDKILSRVFYSGLFLAVGVYLIALFTFRIFNL